MQSGVVARVGEALSIAITIAEAGRYVGSRLASGAKSLSSALPTPFFVPRSLFDNLHIHSDKNNNIIL